MSGTIRMLIVTIAARIPSAISVSCQLYQNINARKIARNGRSSSSVTAAPLTNSRIVSTPCTRATIVPVGRCSK